MVLHHGNRKGTDTDGLLFRHKFGVGDVWLSGTTFAWHVKSPRFDPQNWGKK